MPFEMFQRVSDFFEQRREFRAQALAALRRREGLPEPVDEHGQELTTRFDDQGHAHYYTAAGEKVDRVMFAGAGKDGKPGALAVGKRKGEARELADASWHRADAEFEILDVAEDGTRLEDEVRDLARDAAGFDRVHPASGPRVDLGAEGEQAPGLVIRNPNDDHEIDQTLQEFLRKGVEKASDNRER